jgi:biopolymer transport protein ExbD
MKAQAKFYHRKTDIPMISTASLPDIVFMLLFFFMVTTQLREQNPLVKTKLPKAEQAQELNKKLPILELYVGKPKDKVWGEEVRIFAEGRWLELKQLARFVAEFRDSFNVREAEQLVVNLRVDQETPMGIISDLKLQLREVNALKINYHTLTVSLPN